MSAKQQLIKEIKEAYIFLREKNQTIPSDTLEFTKDAAIKAAEDLSEPHEFNMGEFAMEVPYDAFDKKVDHEKATLSFKRKLDDEHPYYEFFLDLIDNHFEYSVPAGYGGCYDGDVQTPEQLKCTCIQFDNHDNDNWI